MCLSSLGALLAEALQCTYARICCRWQQYVVETGNDLQQDLAHTKKHSQVVKHLNCQPNETRKPEMDVAKDTTHQIKLCLPQQCDFQEHKDDVSSRLFCLFKENLFKYWGKKRRRKFYKTFTELLVKMLMETVERKRPLEAEKTASAAELFVALGNSLFEFIQCLMLRLRCLLLGAAWAAC